MIPAEHRNGLMHRIDFTIGADFSAKWEAYRADGFTVGLCNGYFLACKIMPGESLPKW